MRGLSIMAMAVLASACGNSSGTPAPGSAGRSGAGGGGRGNGGPVPVEVVLVRADTVIDAITATGQIEPIQSIQLRPEVDGRLVEILVREGVEVAQGTPLFRVDDAELKAQVARAQADRDLAQQALTRTRALLADKAAATADVERAEAQMRSTQAGLDLLQVRLDRTVVRAPFAGVTGQRLASLGDYVNNQTRLITLQTVNPQRAAFQVPERYADQLKVGQRVLFRVAALQSRDFIGTVDFVDPLVQLPSRTITIKALVANPKRELQAGMFIEARLETATRPTALVVPEDAVSPFAGAMYVWVVKDDKAERREVTLGVRTPGYVEIVRGLELGEQVVVGGTDRLQPSAAVKPTVVNRDPKRPGSDRGT
ncbi:MAG: efflux RND transporter periplasmic adaptor subunit [Gemmatimonadales bacterium]|nr:efflux RND transporter periplasmic adaptor subunit [Gemmatimonadales bacterium]